MALVLFMSVHPSSCGNNTRVYHNHLLVIFKLIAICIAIECDYVILNSVYNR